MTGQCFRLSHIRTGMLHYILLNKEFLRLERTEDTDLEIKERTMELIES
jgi:hypothetical protein